MATPAFNLTYNTPNVDIGAGYAQGVGQAGAYLAKALSSVTDTMTQSSAANDQIDMMTRMKDAQGNPLMSKDDAEALQAKSLGARQAFVGELMGRLHTSYQEQLDQARAIEVAKQTAAITAPYRQQEIITTAEQQRQSQKELADQQARLEALRNPDNRKMTPTTPTTPTPPLPDVVVPPPSTAAADSVTSPLQMTLNAGKQPNSPRTLFPNPRSQPVRP